MGFIGKDKFIQKDPVNVSMFSSLGHDVEVILPPPKVLFTNMSIHLSCVHCKWPRDQKKSAHGYIMDMKYSYQLATYHFFFFN